MKLKVLFFANYKELLGLSELSLEIADGATVAELSELLASRGEQWQSMFKSNSTKVAINHELGASDSVLQDGDEVAYFPPVTGG